jgi:hypothetical protein
MMMLQQRWNSDKWRQPSGRSAAQGGEGEGEARLPRGSNGGVGGAHHEDELAAALLHDSGVAACFSHRWRMRGNEGEVALTPCLRRRKGGGTKGVSDVSGALLKGSGREQRNRGGRGCDEPATRHARGGGRPWLDRHVVGDRHQPGHSARRRVVNSDKGEATPLTCGLGHSVRRLNPFKSVNSIQMNLNLN